MLYIYFFNIQFGYPKWVDVKIQVQMDPQIWYECDHFLSVYDQFSLISRFLLLVYIPIDSIQLWPEIPNIGTENKPSKMV